MCVNKNEADELNSTKKPGKKKASKTANEQEIMISDILGAISESEYPDYIIEAAERVRQWMQDMIQPEQEQDHKIDDEAEIMRLLFPFDDEDSGIERLISSLESLKEYADIIPNTEKPEGKSDTIIVSITPPDYESGLRTAIDYAAIFNRKNCRRLWIISDTFIFDDVIKFSPYVDALNEQGITMRYILVTPWGWVELPLSGNMAMKQSFKFQMQSQMQSKTEENKHRRKKS